MKITRFVIILLLISSIVFSFNPFNNLVKNTLASESITSFIPDGTISCDYPEIVGAATAHEAIDDPIDTPDGDTYLLKYTGADRKAWFSLPNHTIEDGVILNVTVYVRAVRGGGGYGWYQYCGVIVNSTSYLEPTGGYTLTTSWETYSYSWTVRPNDSMPWTWNDIDNLGIGCRTLSSNTDAKVTQVYAKVFYNTLSVTTNASTGVEETNATLNAWIYKAQEDVSGFFQYGTTTSYGTNTSKQYPLNENDTFNENINSLSPGTLYHFRAVVNDSGGNYSYGDDMTFTTKPNPPTGLTTTPNNNSMGLSWSKGSGATKTYIERNTSSSWNRGDGIFIYNNTGVSTTDTGLNPGTRYYYQAWSYTDTNYSDTYDSTDDYTKPNKPYDLDGELGENYLNITWSAGTGADTTLIRKKTGSYPTSATDGTLLQNNSLTFYNDTYTDNIYYSLWSYNSSGVDYSEQVNFTYGGLIINCYDEDTGENLTFDVLVSNADGSEVYSQNDCVNTTTIDVSLCPQGSVSIYIEAENYTGRVYYMTIYENNWYTLNAYLAAASPPGSGGECQLRPYIDSSNVLTYLVDKTIYFTYELEDIINVEIYNTTLYGTYGGWYYISNEDYNFTETQLTINKSVLDVNITMARVNYYYMYCPGDIETALYYLRIVETITTSYSSYDNPIEGVFVEIKRYINATGTYTTVSSLYTDANGYVNVYLAVENPVKVFLSKTGYNSTVSEYIPTPPNQYGQTTEKTFRIEQIYTPPETPLETKLETIVITKYNTTAFQIFYLNLNNNTNSVNFTFFDGDTLLYYYNTSTNPNNISFYWDFSSYDLNNDILRLTAVSYKTNDTTNSFVRYMNIYQKSASSNSSSAPIMFLISVGLLFFGLTLMHPKHTFGAIGIIIIIIAIAITAFANPQTWYIHLIQACEFICLMFTFLIFKEEGTNAV